MCGSVWECEGCATCSASSGGAAFLLQSWRGRCTTWAHTQTCRIGFTRKSSSVWGGRGQCSTRTSRRSGEWACSDAVSVSCPVAVPAVWHDSPLNLHLCSYLRQFQDEVLRMSTLAPYAARFSDEEVTVGGYTLPPKVGAGAGGGGVARCCLGTSVHCASTPADSNSAGLGSGPGGCQHLARA